MTHFSQSKRADIFVFVFSGSCACHPFIRQLSCRAVIPMRNEGFSSVTIWPGFQIETQSVVMTLSKWDSCTVDILYVDNICAALQTGRFFSLVLFLFWWGTRTVLKVRKLTSHDSTKLWYWQDSCLFTVNKPFISRSENSKHYNNSTSLLSPINSI